VEQRPALGVGRVKPSRRKISHKNCKFFEEVFQQKGAATYARKEETQ
jgi:hypothetical protein